MEQGLKLGERLAILATAGCTLQCDQLRQRHDKALEPLERDRLDVRSQLIVAAAAGHFAEQVDVAERRDQREVQTAGDRALVELEWQPGRRAAKIRLVGASAPTRRATLSGSRA